MMKKIAACCLILSLFIFSISLEGFVNPADNNWPTWRGPTSDGVAPEGCNPPVTWSETENIKWKINLPGSGHSSPVIWQDKIFFQTAIPVTEDIDSEQSAPPQRNQRMNQRGRGNAMGISSPATKHKFDLICLDRKTGKQIWQSTACEVIPHEGHHQNHGFASYSPVTDGKLIWANFGSRGLHCFDMDGDLKWSKDLGKMTTPMSFGEGSSPVLAGDAVIVVMDQQGDSFIIAVNKNTSETLWKKDRDEGTTWATPFVIEVDGKIQVITNATKFIRSYDAQTGDLIWQCSGQVSNVIPSPVTGHGMIYCTSGYRGASLQAIKLGNRGNLSGTDAVAWQVNQACPYVSSPLLYQGKIYVSSVTTADISCYDALTGKPFFVKQRLDDVREIYASPVGAAGRVYYIGRNGTTKVLKNSGKLEVLATNVLNTPIDCSPAIIDNEIYLKGKNVLYCIAEK